MCIDHCAIQLTFESYRQLQELLHVKCGVALHCLQGASCSHGHCQCVWHHHLRCPGVCPLCSGRNVLQRVAVCCRVLPVCCQCVAVCCRVAVLQCCSVLQCVAVCCVWHHLLRGLGVCPLCSVRSVLQCTAVYCSVLQCVAVCCSVFCCVAEGCSVLQCIASVLPVLSVLQCVAVCCGVLRCVAVCCNVLCLASSLASPRHLSSWIRSKRVAACCSVLQCVAVCCGVLQCFALRCNVLQFVAVYC